MNQGPFDNDNQFVVSLELLQLLRWLLEFEQEPLKKLVQRAINNGFQDKNNKRNLVFDFESSEELQQAILDFFIMLETLLYESMDENEVKKVCQKDLIPAINNIDSRIYGNNILDASVAKAKAAFEHNPTAKAKDNVKAVFCKELLKRWKPSKKTIVN